MLEVVLGGIPVNVVICDNRHEPVLRLLSRVLTGIPK